MYIGTAVPDPEELAAAPHHFIQNKSIHEAYSVGQFEREALQTLSKLFEKNEFAIMVGGSGLYVDAVVNGLDDFPEIAPEIRTNLNKRLTEEGLEALQKQLLALDPETYHNSAIDNPHRVIRALEVCIGSGTTYSSFKNKPKKARDFDAFVIGLESERSVLYDRINKRVDIMVENGLLDEAKALYPLRELNALQTVGYRELFSYFDGDITKEFAIEEIKKNTRRFAKRQLTWFRKNKQIIWFDYQTPSAQIIPKIEAILKKNR